jgi:hypothetical protein
MVGHGGWLPWLKTEFGWHENTALNFVRVYEMSKSTKLCGFRPPAAFWSGRSLQRVEPGCPQRGRGASAMGRGKAVGAFFEAGSPVGLLRAMPKAEAEVVSRFPA